MKQLTDKIKAVTNESQTTTWGVIIEHLNTNNKISINEHETFAAQSVIKVPIMAAVFAAYENNELNLSDELILKREDHVGGSGVLQHMSPGTELTIYDVVTLMIIQSDNTATNMLIDLLGFTNIQQVMETYGMKQSVLRKKLMIYPVTDIDVENYLTPTDIHLFYKKLALGRIVSRFSSQEMIKILKRQQVSNALPIYLPINTSPFVGVGPTWELAHKTGWDIANQHDVGILYVRDQCVVMTVLTKGGKSIQTLNAIGRIGKVVYDYLSH